jgi:acyl-homoserine lactone acylase PvdQ
VTGTQEVRPTSDATAEVRLKPDATTAQSHASVARGGGLSVSEASARFEHPATRYIVHLDAPGWNVIGATRPWLPGIAIGHNARVAWGPATTIADTQDIYVEPASAVQRTIVKDAIAVKGRKSPFEFEVELTPHGVVIASDREHGRVFTVRWSGTEAGGAAELGALAINRAASWTDFRRALAAWRMPARRVVFADSDGNIGYQDAALVPVRRSREWDGWTAADDLPSVYNPRVKINAGEIKQAATHGADQMLFAHVLAITAAARGRYNVGPMTPGPDDSTLRAVFDPREWDRSSIVVAPGQSESPDSPHFRDLANRWARGESVPLAFSDTAVQANAESTLTLVPRAK